MLRITPDFRTATRKADPGHSPSPNSGHTLSPDLIQNGEIMQKRQGSLSRGVGLLRGARSIFYRSQKIALYPSLSRCPRPGDNSHRTMCFLLGSERVWLSPGPPAARQHSKRHCPGQLALGSAQPASTGCRASFSARLPLCP